MSAPYGGDHRPQPLRPEDERLWSTLIALGGIVFGFFAPLVGYLVFRDRGPFVKEHSRTALNFQITILIANVVGAVTTIFVVGFLLLAAASILNIVFSILAAVSANRGRYYRYPLSIDLVKD
jgi:hypothetical protein